MRCLAQFSAGPARQETPFRYDFGALRLHKLVYLLRLDRMSPMSKRLPAYLICLICLALASLSNANATEVMPAREILSRAIFRFYPGDTPLCFLDVRYQENAYVAHPMSLVFLATYVHTTSLGSRLGNNCPTGLGQSQCRRNCILVLMFRSLDVAATCSDIELEFAPAPPDESSATPIMDYVTYFDGNRHKAFQIRNSTGCRYTVVDERPVD